MIFPDFLQTLSEHWQSHMPFVAYRKPNETTVKAFLQSTDELFLVKDYKESGFVMAPFDSRDDAVLLPLEACESLQVEFSSDIVSGIQSVTSESINQVEKEQHVELVSKVIKAIRAGLFDKVVLSRQETIKTFYSPIELFEKLLETYPTAFVFLWYHPKVGTWLGATPETLLSIENNRFKTMALAGTQAFNGSTNVSWGAKEKEEQGIVTKAIIENLKPTVETFSISEPIAVKAGNLLHLKTTISGSLKNADLESLLESLHPTPAVCGFPKQAAKKFILQNEGYNRTFYTGFLGELNFQETKTRNTNRRNVENNAYGTVKKVSNLFVSLRCMQLTNEREAILYIGGGITKDSDPEAEWEETVEKAKTMKQVL